MENNNIPKFKVGDRLQAGELDKEEWGLEFVTIIKVNEESQVYHWEAVIPNLGFRMRSGTFFKHAVEYKE